MVQPDPETFSSRALVGAQVVCLCVGGQVGGGRLQLSFGTQKDQSVHWLLICKASFKLIQQREYLDKGNSISYQCGPWGVPRV